MFKPEEQEPFNTTEPQDPVGGQDFDHPEIGSPDPLNGSGNPLYDEIEPIFEYKSGEFNLKYQEFLPFVFAYLIYRWC